MHKMTIREFFSQKGVFSVRNLVTMAVLLAARAILNLPILTIYITPQFKLISFTYLMDAMVAMLFGPVAGLIFGFAGDGLGYLLSAGGGAYFPGFALSEMVTCFLFALSFYRREIRLPRVIAAWAVNLVIVQRGMNSLWLILMYGMSAGSVFTFARVLNSVLQAPLHIALLRVLLPRVVNIYKRFQ